MIHQPSRLSGLNKGLAGAAHGMRRPRRSKAPPHLVGRDLVRSNELLLLLPLYSEERLGGGGGGEETLDLY